MGAYASARNLAAERVVRVPADISAQQAAATLLKGMSAHYLLHDSYRVQAGSTVVVHAATGGVGSLLVPWAKHKGAKVIALVGAATKVARAHALGADVVVDTATDEWVAAVLHATAGRGADCVYDSVGKDTFLRSLACLRVRGTLVSYGQSSGAVPPVDVLELGKKSVFLTRPSLWDHTATRSELLDRAAAVHQLLAAGILRAEVGAVWPLAQAAEAHRALQARMSSGSTLLIP
jgi:NADPH2:quinone reductase